MWRYKAASPATAVRSHWVSTFQRTAAKVLTTAKYKVSAYAHSGSLRYPPAHLHWLMIGAHDADLQHSAATAHAHNIAVLPGNYLKPDLCAKAGSCFIIVVTFDDFTWFGAAQSSEFNAYQFYR